MRIAISSGHSTKCRGAADIIDEVDEATRVVRTVAGLLIDAEVDTAEFHDTKSTTQQENLNRIVNWHNAQERDLDVSVHFNAYEHTERAMGTECLYVTQSDLAADVSDAIATAGDLIDRGPKKRTDLFFLNNTDKPAILIEVCFVDSEADVRAYRDNFQPICQAITHVLAGDAASGGDQPDPTPELPVHVEGTCSWFGGPDDDGVAPDEGLAFLYKTSDAPDLFLPTQPPGTTGLARRLDPEAFYVAIRWDYNVTPKDMLRDQSLKAMVRANGKQYLARPADWGPNENTGRVADLSPGLLEALGLTTDDVVEVTYPASAEPVQDVARVDITATGPVQITINGQPVGARAA